jgi:hypothetical protein
MIAAGPALEGAAWSEVRRRAVLGACKWDPQVGDVPTLARYPLLLSRAAWDELARLAEALARETLAAEAELASRPELHARLGMPRPLLGALRRAAVSPTPTLARVLRFDFHWTRDGWRVSEVNADVPGGFAEGTAFTRLVAERDGRPPCGAPGLAWTDALASRVPGGRVALLCARGLMEDQQVVAYLGGLLARRGVRVAHGCPSQVSWRGGRASLRGALDGIVRFFQAEWLPREGGLGWRRFFADGLTPVAHPGTAILVESKRFPLAWPDLRTPLPTWRRLLPETRDPREAPGGEEWVLKAALSNNGDGIVLGGAAPRRAERWASQRRFEIVPVDGPDGVVHPCVGVFVVEGRCAGAYARVSGSPVIDHLAADASLLLDDRP